MSIASLARNSVKNAIKKGANKLGIKVSRFRPTADEPDKESDLIMNQEHDEIAIIQRHEKQTQRDIDSLNEKYSKPVFGEISPWELVLMLGQVVDPTDRSLGNASQLTHVLQIIDSMKTDGVLNDEFLLMAIIHDWGKLLLLTDEDPANVVCMNKFISPPNEKGMHKHVSQWNHDEFAYMRLKDYLTPELSWLIRYHSIMPHNLDGYTDEKDEYLQKKYHSVFYKYDQGSKSPKLRPYSRIQEYRGFIEGVLPSKIIF